MNTRWNAYRSELLRAMGLAPILLAGCAVEALGDTEDGAELQQQPPPGTLGLTQPGALFTGTPVDFFVTGATPGVTVYLGAGWGQGAGPCPPVLGGMCLDITTNLKVLGQAVANGAGQASIEVMLAHEMPEGFPLYFQAVQANPQAKSPVLADTAAYPARTCGDHPWLDATTYMTEYEVLACGPMPASGTCPAPAAITYQQSNWLFTYATGQPTTHPWGGYQLDLDCWEDTVEDACCYHGFINQWAVGRPFEVGGEVRVARQGTDPSWCPEVALDLSSLSRSARRRLAWAWTQQARGEHASVASFARFVLQLMQAGAPADLVAEATRAMGDEVRHARDAFGIASALAGEPVSAGALDTFGATDAMTLEAIVRATVREGCIGETIAAAQAREARDGCLVGPIREVLEVIAADEGRHAQLAWRFVAWAVRHHPELAAVVREEIEAGPDCPQCAPDAHEATLRAWGQLPERRLQAVAREVHVQVVQICGRALLQVRDEPGAMIA